MLDFNDTAPAPEIPASERREAVRAMLPTDLWYSVEPAFSLAEGTDREAAYAAAGVDRSTFIGRISIPTACRAELCPSPPVWPWQKN